jgi:hypothetical protein
MVVALRRHVKVRLRLTCTNSRSQDGQPLEVQEVRASNSNLQVIYLSFTSSYL